MKITNLRIQNFLTIGEIQCSLNDKGLVLIQGDNQDDTSQDSNGAGKSSVPDALCWCLFGSTARGEAGDRVINRTAKKNCLVELNIVDGDNEYLVTRYRKHSQHKNRLTLFRLEKNTEVDLTKGTDKLTQETLIKILGCSEEVFKTAIYAGQDVMPDLPAMTDKQLKALIEEAAGIDRLQQAHAVALKRLRDAQRSVEIKESEITNTRSLLNVTEGYIEDLKAQIEKFDENQKKEIDAMAADIKTESERYKKQLPEAKKKLDKIAEIQKEIDKISERLASAKSESDELQELSDKKASLESRKQIVKNEYQKIQDEVRKRLEELRHIEDKVGTDCTECGKPYSKEDLSDAETAIKRKIKELKELAESKKSEFGSVSKSVSDAVQAFKSFRDSMTDVSDEIATQRALQRNLSTYQTEVNEVRGMKQAINDKKELLEKKKAEENPYHDMLKKRQAESKKRKAELNKLKDDLKELEEAKTVAKFAENVFGNAGVRAHILDTVTPFLNQRTSEYLFTLSDGNISAIWSTISQTAKGELREKFQIDVSSSVGANTFKGLSGGEKRKVRLACSMALQDLVSSRASKPIDLYIADEIDHAIDEAGLERLMNLLDAKAKLKGTVLVISHNSLNSYIRQVVTIVKENGYSRLEGAL